MRVSRLSIYAEKILLLFYLRYRVNSHSAYKFFLATFVYVKIKKGASVSNLECLSKTCFVSVMYWESICLEGNFVGREFLRGNTLTETNCNLIRLH